MSEIEIALVGCGGMMGVHVHRGFKQLWEKGFRTFKIVACVDVNENAAQKMAAEIAQWQNLRPKVYTDVDDFIAQESSANAVDISLPHHLHHTVAIACLKSGRHVLIEKPLAITMRAARKIIEAAKNKGLILSVAENFRRAPHQRAIKWAIKQGRIGEPKQVYWVDTFERIWYWGWRDHLELAGGGWTLDGGVHFADLMRYHVGEVVEVSAQMANFKPIRLRKVNEHKEEINATVEDTTQALLKFENGALGVWVEATTAPARKSETRIIYGTEGAIDLNTGLFLRDREQPISISELQREFMASLSESEKERLFPFGITDDIAQEVHEFVVACLENDPKVEIDGDEGYRSQAVCMAIYEAATLMQTISVADVMALKVEAYQRPLNERWQIF
ncbi:MAG: Gfo/Idh/MocA family oxidoreductase [Armatimonadetes bacterium]|nr:Gfo/Idh/MocA family oxidoreductase [Armatimonadota bacterium]